MVRHIPFDTMKAIIIASPGFTKDQFMEYVLAESLRKDMRTVQENKGKFMLVHTSSGHLHALKEVLASESVASKLADTKAAGEVRALNSFYEMLKADPYRAFYGMKHVNLAHERQAIGTLLLVDDLFRAADITTRLTYVSLVDSVKAQGATVHIFSSLHPSGEQLLQLGGVAAVLRFPLPELEDEVVEEQ
jgi:protein pelota